MLRTTHAARRGQAALAWLGEVRLPAGERRAERATLRRLRTERDNTEHTAWARAAAIEAERRRWGAYPWTLGDP